MAYFSNFAPIEYDFDGNGINKTIKNIAQYSTIISKNLDNAAFYSYYNILDGERPDNVSEKLYGSAEYYWIFFIINDGLQNYWADWPKGSEPLRNYCEQEFIGLAAIFEADVDAFGKFVIGGTVTGSLSGATGTVKAIFPTQGYIQIEQDKTSSANFRTAGETITLTASNSTLAADIARVSNSIPCISIVKTAYAPAYHIDDGTLERTRRRTAGTTSVTHFEEENRLNIEKSKIKVIKPAHIGKVVTAFEKAMREA
jgi:hypothetical protein